MIALPNSTDVFVIGGGPAGLAAAIAVRRLGLDVAVADSSHPPIDKSCGEGIMPDGIAAALSLGIHLDSETRAQSFRGIRFCADGLSVEAAFPHGPGVGLRRTVLHQLLVDRAAAAGVRLLWGACVSGIGPQAVTVDGRDVRTRWIVGADGTQSRVRHWAGLDAVRYESRRFGFRRHYPVAAWTDFVEIHWGDGCQLYITPVGATEICVVLISRDPHLHLDDALPHFPDVMRRLRGPAPERAAVTASCRLRSVHRGEVALIGDASGSVDAVTGEGLCLLFQQSIALAAALRAGDLRLYESAHRRLARRPELMARLMLLLDRHTLVRRGAMGLLAARPRLFARMLAMHVAQPLTAHPI